MLKSSSLRSNPLQSLTSAGVRASGKLIRLRVWMISFESDSIMRRKERGRDHQNNYPYKVIKITPPPKSLGVRCFPPNLQCGESVTIEGQAYTISSVTHRYQLRKGKYEPSEKRLDVLSTGRYLEGVVPIVYNLDDFVGVIYLCADAVVNSPFAVSFQVAPSGLQFARKSLRAIEGLATETPTGVSEYRAPNPRYVRRQGGANNRDDFLTLRYVRRQERSIRRSTFELDADDAVNISLWVETHQTHVFFYGDFTDSSPFTLGIQTEWQLQQMIRFGNRSLIAFNSRFGTNKMKYPVQSLIVFNSEKKAIPVAWIISPSFASVDSYNWMRALYNRAQTKDPTWKLAGFIVDDPLTDVLAIRDVFECSVLLSFWRVRHAWHKNLLKRCSGIELCAELSRRLGQAVDDICRKKGGIDLFDNFMEDFVECSNFMDYFKAIWYPRIGAWITALQTLQLSGQETFAAMEFYHNQLKLRLMNESDANAKESSTSSQCKGSLRVEV